MKDKTSYTVKADFSLVILWIGALTLLFVMLYNWMLPLKERTLAERPENIFVDQLLLSTQDLQLGETANLINITLNRGDVNTQEPTKSYTTVNTTPDRKLVYSKILDNKIKNISSNKNNTPNNNNNNGFTIKPLPQ